MNLAINDKVFEQFPFMETERLVLRAFEYSDVRNLFELRSNEEVMQFLDTDYHLSEADSASMIENIHSSFIDKKGINWVISEKERNEFIGYIGFWRLIRENVRAEIGYALHPNFWGNGYMKEAAKKILEYGFSEFGLHSVEANVNKDNVKSICLLENLGFNKEAHFRENYFYNNKFYDSIIYSLLETDIIGGKK